MENRWKKRARQKGREEDGSWMRWQESCGEEDTGMKDKEKRSRKKTRWRRKEEKEGQEH